MPMSLADGERVARGLLRLLEPACERIEIAGSIRRRKAEVKDIELVAIPHIRRVQVPQYGLFGPTTDIEDELDALIQQWLADGVARRRLDKHGRQRIGRAYKALMIDYGEPGMEWVALDLFSVIPPAQWGLIFMIRTGSGVGPNGDPRDGFGPAMLARWKQVSGGGESIGGRLHRPNGEPVDTPEEEDVFRVCQVEWVPPELRTSAAAVRGLGSPGCPHCGAPTPLGRKWCEACGEVL